MAFVSFAIAYMTNLYLIVMLIYISNLAVIAILVEILSQQKPPPPVPQDLKPMETARPPPSQDKSSENTDPHPIQPRIARSVLYIDATQEIDTGNDQM
ncbi:hypothetical protein COOONC_25502, partial [Cooperia oncophora]